MMQELIEFVSGCPAVSGLDGGVNPDFGGNAGLTLTADPTLDVLCRYQDGSVLLRRGFKAEVHLSFRGDTDAICTAHRMYEDIQSYIFKAPYPKIRDGEIINIVPDSGGNLIKSGIYEGYLPFKFSVYYIDKLRGQANVQYRI